MEKAITIHTTELERTMNSTELSQRVQFVIDAEGHKSAVLVSLDDWEQLLNLLKDLEDVEEIRLAREKKAAIPSEQNQTIPHPLLQFAGILNDEEAAALQATIIDEFEKIDTNAW